MGYSCKRHGQSFSLLRVLCCCYVHSPQPLLLPAWLRSQSPERWKKQAPNLPALLLSGMASLFLPLSSPLPAREDSSSPGSFALHLPHTLREAEWRVGEVAR